MTLQKNLFSSNWSVFHASLPRGSPKVPINLFILEVCKVSSPQQSLGDYLCHCINSHTLNYFSCAKVLGKISRTSMDLYSSYVQVKIYGQVLHKEFLVIHKKDLINYFCRKHPQLPFLNYSYYLILEELRMCTQTKQKGRITGMKFCKCLFTTDYTQMLY